jgi:tetratricopeptide (TPR) repeat protein
MVVLGGCATVEKAAYDPSKNENLSVTIEESRGAIVDALSRCGSGSHAISFKDISVGDSSLTCTPSCLHQSIYYPVPVPYSSIGTTVLRKSQNCYWVETGGITYNYRYNNVWVGWKDSSRALEFSWTSTEPAKRFVDAIFLLKQSASGATPLTYVERGRILRDQGKLQEAQTYARKAVEYYPRLGLAFTEENLLDVLDLAKRRKVAEEAVSSAQRAEADGDIAMAFGMFSKAHVWTPDPEVIDRTRGEIMRLYPKLTAPPEFPEAARRSFVQAEWHVKNEAYEAAVEAFSRVTICCPWHTQSYYNRGLILGQLKRYREAIEELKRYLILAPTAVNARTVQDRIYLWEAEQNKNK